MISSYIYVSVATLKQAMEELTAHLKNTGPFEVSVHTPLGSTATATARYTVKNTTRIQLRNGGDKQSLHMCSQRDAGLWGCISQGFVITLSSNDALNDEIEPEGM